MPCPPPGDLPSPGIAHCPLNWPHRPPRLPAHDPLPWPPPDVSPTLPAAPGPPTFPLPQGPCIFCSTNVECFSLCSPHLPRPLLQALSSSLGERPHSTSPMKTLTACPPQLQVPRGNRQGQTSGPPGRCHVPPPGTGRARCWEGPKGGSQRMRVTSTGQQAPACSQQQASGEDSASLHGPNPLLPLTLLCRQALPLLMTTPPAGTGFWAQGADGLCCPGWAHLQGLLIPGETWLHSRLLGPSGLSFPIYTMGALMVFTCRAAQSVRVLWMGSCSVSYKGLCMRRYRACARAPRPGPAAPGTRSPPWGCRRARRRATRGREALGPGAAAHRQCRGAACLAGLAGGCRAHSCLLGLVMNQTR